MLRRFLIALQFMSVFRISGDLAETDQDMAASVGYYPVVGLIFGCLLALISIPLLKVFSPFVTGVLLVLGLAVFTNGLHLDGLADTADGLFSHKTKDEKLRIMKDSRIGVFGALALFFILTIKIALLTDLAANWRLLILFPMWGRAAASLTACIATYARSEGGLGRPFVNLAGNKELLLSQATAFLFAAVLMGVLGVVITGVVVLIALASTIIWKRQLGGITGDVLGAVIESGECLSLASATVLINLNVF